MVDIDLVRGRLALQVQFRESLAADLLFALSLVMGAPHTEGFDQWVYATFAALPATLKGDLEQVLTFTQKSGKLVEWLYRLPPHDPVHHDFPAFIAWLQALSEKDFSTLIEDSLTHLADCCEEEGDETDLLEAPGGLRTVIAAHFSEEHVDRVTQLVRNPVELKAQFISVLTRFWEQFYQQEYQRCLPLMQRSVEHHRRQTYSGDLTAIFSAVTGRRFPKGYEKYEDVERVFFFPSCHIGPYVAFNPISDPEPALGIQFNCRPTGTLEGGSMPAIEDLFPPLKALADETRLQILSLLDGRELYAQEIVAQLDITQSAVSRHLKLMVAGGLLNVRKKDSMKYFSVNEETLAGLAERLKDFRGT